MDQPAKVANPARGQLNRENNIPLSPCVPENLVSRDGFSRPVPRQPAHLHTQAESGAYLRDSSRVPRRRPFMKTPYAIGSVPSLSGHAIAYRWRSLPRVRRHRASKPQGSSERVLPWQINMDQLIFAVFFGLATNTLNVRNNNNSNNKLMYHKKMLRIFSWRSRCTAVPQVTNTKFTEPEGAPRFLWSVMSQPTSRLPLLLSATCGTAYDALCRPCFPVLHRF